jgi:hypothetical protein
MALTSKRRLAASLSRARRTSSTIGSLDMAYSSNTYSGVQMTGHSYPCCRQMEASALTIAVSAMCTQFQVTGKSML